MALSKGNVLILHGCLRRAVAPGPAIAVNLGTAIIFKGILEAMNPRQNAQKFEETQQKRAGIAPVYHMRIYFT